MKFIDVCAGVGGFRMAMESHGHECVYTIEYNKDAIKSLKSTWKFDKNEAWFGDMYEIFMPIMASPKNPVFMRFFTSYHKDQP